MAALWTFEEAARRLYGAVQAHREAKATLRKYREERGSCEWVLEAQSPEDERTVECYRREPYDPGLQYDPPEPTWCDVCKDSQPLWEAYRAAAVTRGAALRTFMAVGQRTKVAA